MNKNLFESIRKKVNEDSDLLSQQPEEAPAIPEITEELIEEMYSEVGDESINKEQFGMGLQVEMEHYDSMNKDMFLIAKIVVDHLREIPTYYTYLSEMEAKALEDMKNTEEVPGEEMAPETNPKQDPISADEGKLPKNPAEYTEKDIKTLFETSNDNVVPKGDYDEVNVSGKVLGKINLPKALRGEVVNKENGKKLIKLLKDNPKAPGADKYILI